MRQIINFNAKWAFTKQATELPSVMPLDWNFVNLPHSWNAIDGQDGGNDYYRGTAYYAKPISRMKLPKPTATTWSCRAPTPPPTCTWTASTWLTTTAATPPGAWTSPKPWVQ